MIGVNIFQILFCAGLLVLNCESTSLPRKTFRCHNGKYIADSAFCNTVDNCGDGSDEATGCDWIHCDAGQYACMLTQKCLDMRVRCNMKEECPGGFDEIDCGDEINVHNCSLADGKFLCHDGLKCLDFEYTCDGNCNCFDCSDENTNCTKVDHNLLGDCPHSYFPTPNGPECFCDSKNNELNKLCKEMKNCTNQNPCQQRCVKYKDKFQCSCYDDYVEIAGTNGFKCRSKVYSENSLVYATSSRIKILNLTNNEVSVIKTNVECRTLTAAFDNVYYATYYDKAKSIFKTSITSKATTQIIKSNSAITSIAVDYIANNIYFTSNTSLSVCSIDGKICTQMKCCNVTYVALAPKFGLMFYTMKSNFKDELFIVKSNMDGLNEQLMIDGTFRYPVPLAVEESIQKLYWLENNSEHANVIHSVSFNGGTNQVEFLKFLGTMSSFTALGSVFYYTKNRDNQIYIVENIEKDLAFPIEMLTDTNATKIYDNNLTISIRKVYAYNPIINSAKEVINPCKESSCSGLCLLRPAYSINQLDRTCVCNDFTPTNTQNWCKTPSKPSDFDFSPKKDAVILQKSSQTSSKTTFVMILVIVIILVALILYSWFRGWMCYGYYDTIRDCMNKPNRMDDTRIYTREDL